MNVMRALAIAVLAAASALSTAQQPSTPEPAPTPRPADAPEPVAEVHEIEIVEPAPPGDPTPRATSREYRVVESDGERLIWVNEAGDAQDLGEEMGLALEFNPEIRAIRAEIQALQARLEQLELKTATDIARKRVEIRRLHDQRAHDKELVEKNFKTPRELAEVEAEIAAREMELNYLVGMKPGRLLAPIDRLRVISSIDSGDAPALAGLVALLGESRPALDSIANESLRDKLENPISVLFEQTALHEVIDFMNQVYELNFNVDVTVRDIMVDINLKDVPVKDALAALADSNANLVFVIREYGIFATTRQRALSVPGPSIPADVPYAKRGDRPFAPMPAGVLHLKDRDDKPEKDKAPKAKDGDERMKFDGVVVEEPVITPSPRR